MSREYSEGPWSWRSVDGGWDGVVDASGELLCRLVANVPENARLMAAAPDLLDACEAVLWWNERVGGMCEPEDERDVLEPLRAAIAKALTRDPAPPRSRRP